MNAWLEVPRGWLDSFGEIARFGSRVAGLVYSGRVFRFFGESLRQAGILILGSAMIIWGLVFILGLQCGIEGAYLLRAQGAPAYVTLAMVMVTAMLVTPFLNNAATVLVMAPVAAGFASSLGLNTDPFLMAVAIGAGCDRAAGGDLPLAVVRASGSLHSATRSGSTGCGGRRRRLRR